MRQSQVRSDEGNIKIPHTNSGHLNRTVHKRKCQNGKNEAAGKEKGTNEGSKFCLKLVREYNHCIIVFARQ